MKANVGSIDRIVRLAVGVSIMLAGYYHQAWWGFIGLVPFLTGVVGNCALYTILGLTTRRRGDAPAVGFGPKADKVI